MRTQNQPILQSYVKSLLWFVLRETLDKMEIAKEAEWAPSRSYSWILHRAAAEKKKRNWNVPCVSQPVFAVWKDSNLTSSYLKYETEVDEQTFRDIKWKTDALLNSSLWGVQRRTWVPSLHSSTILLDVKIALVLCIRLLPKLILKYIYAAKDRFINTVALSLKSSHGCLETKS